MTAQFAGRARVASGTRPTRRTQPYRVTVADGRLDLVLDATGSSALRADLARVTARPLGHAGAVVVEVAGQPVLVDFSDRHHGSGPTRVVRRALHAVAGRRVRRRFLGALEP